jgi:glycosyltransferase involved in cell wall biosynthesis
MTSVAIIHNHPIHYQRLLFSELARRGLEFEVLFTAASSGARMGGLSPLAEKSEYRCSVAHAGTYEEAPKWGTARFVWRALDRLRPVVVIISGYADIAAWTGWLWAETHGAKKILWSESNLFDHPRRAWRELPKRFFVSRCDAAHVYGTAGREYLEKLGMPREKIVTKRAVADTELFLSGNRAPGVKAGPIRMVYCGRLSPEKNVPILLHAFARLGRKAEPPRIVLKLVGDGPEANSLHKIADDLGLEGTVEFAGFASQTALQQILADSDVLVLPSKSETWGLVVNEAMLSGLPVAASERCGCVVDLVRPETGWTFSPNNVAELTRLLGSIADTPREILEAMGQAGRSLAAEYSAENCAKAVIAMVNSLLPVPTGEAPVAEQGN